LKASAPAAGGKQRKQTDLQFAEHQERLTSLIRRINDWINVRDIYIPGAPLAEAAHARLAKPTPNRSLDVHLWLPSSLTPELRSMCLHDAANIEFKYRIGQGTSWWNQITK
jgi:hypothetical protein